MQGVARVRPAAAPGAWQTLVLIGLLVTAGSIHYAVPLRLRLGEAPGA